MQTKKILTEGLLFSLLVLGFFSSHAYSVPPEKTKLKPEDLIQRHLQAMGSPEARQGVSERTLEGEALFSIVVGGSGQLFGPATLISEGNKSLLVLQFDYDNYPKEQIAFDGKDWHVARVTPHGRSPLGSFIYAYGQIVREGLLGSCLSTAWPLANLRERKPKLKYRGLRKVGERELHQLSYKPRKGGRDLQINLFFEPETFRHVRTEYEVTVRSGQRSSADLRAGDVSANEIADRFRLEETFSEFREVEGLTLPTRWEMRYAEERLGGNSPAPAGLVVEYKIGALRILHNQSVDPASFKQKE